jgi:hypothetical protein
MDASVQKTIGQVALNTGINGGDLEKGLETTFLSMGTGFLGSEVASATGSELAGRVAANATNQLVRTGDVNLTGLASGEIGKLVGSEVADETGSGLLGKAASSVTSSTIQGKDATTGLLNLGIGEAVNTAFNAGNDIITGAPKAETVSDITGGDTTATSNATDTVLGTTGVLDTVTGEDTVLTGDTTPVGGLAAVTQTPTITTSDDTGSTAVVIPDDLSTVTSATSPTISIDDLTNVTKVTSPVITEGDDVIDVVDDADLTPVVTGATTTATTPTTTVATGDEDDLQKKIDEIIAPEVSKTTSVVTADDVVSPTTATTTVDEVPTGGLNIIQQTQTDEPKVDPVTGEVKTPTTSSNIPLAGSGIVSGLIKSNLTKSLNKSMAPAKKPAGGLKTALKPVNPVKKQAAAPKMDISKLIPIAKAPVKPTAPKGTLTPVTNIAGLTSMLKKKG